MTIIKRTKKWQNVDELLVECLDAICLREFKERGEEVFEEADAELEKYIKKNLIGDEYETIKGEITIIRKKEN
jgi:hypothetical protein